MKQTLYLNQPLADNIIETVLLIATLLFLVYVIKIAFFEQDD